MTPALVAAAIVAPLLRPEPWSAVAHQQASSADGALTGATSATGGRHTARASNGSRWPTGRPHAHTLWACGRDGPGLSSLRAEDGRVPPHLVRTLCPFINYLGLKIYAAPRVAGWPLSTLEQSHRLALHAP